MDPAGYVDVKVLLALPQFRGISLTDLQTIVDICPKKRFGIKHTDNGVYIRANQGHTLDNVLADKLLTPVTAVDIGRFPIVVHGTNTEAWTSIKKNGLNRMSRQHIHFAKGLPGDDGVISGMRKSSQVLIYIDLEKALAVGIPFFVSDNGVLLSPGQGNTNIIPPTFFTMVTDNRTGKTIYHQHQHTSVGIPEEDTLTGLKSRLDALPKESKNAIKRIKRKIANIKANTPNLNI